MLTCRVPVHSILLDHVGHSARLYQNPLDHQRITDPSLLAPRLDSLAARAQQGNHVVVMMAYEAGFFFQSLPCAQPPKSPLMETWEFSKMALLNSDQVQDWFEEYCVDPSEPSGIIEPALSRSADDYERIIDQIHEHIRSGESYQMNFTVDLTGSIYGDPLALYQRLRLRQPGAFNAFIRTEDGFILSHSPEGFIEHRNGFLKCTPMKGTLAIEQGSATALADDPKNRAENIMIVDLIRNDLSNISLDDSIKVPDLFAVQAHGSVLQMTSSITSSLKPEITLASIFRSIFPCGSVTGAPKRRTMELLSALEERPRGWYCGTLGYLEPSDHSLPSFNFNVAIRTLEIDASQHFRMGVGSGITLDSSPIQEWQECKAKTLFITECISQVGLFETMRVEQNTILLLESHLTRLMASASQLQIKIDEGNIRTQLHKTLKLLTSRPYRLKLSVKPQGTIAIQTSDILPLPSVSLLWAQEILPDDTMIMDSFNPLLQHKVALRPQYDRVLRRLETLREFDALFLNERGEVTEGARSNIFVLHNGIWATPPVTCGALPGVMRSKLLQDPLWKTEERILIRQDIESAQSIILCNALRGVVTIDQS